jgi:TonB-linked SusC/RagA family outer membrane protein
MAYGRAGHVVLCGVMVAGAAEVARAQGAVTVTGLVRTGEGAPLSDVSIEVRPLQAGGITRADGRYNIVIPAARQAGGRQVTVFARRLGYRSESRTVTLPNGGSLTVDLTLVTNPLQLGEVVVTGAGTASTTERLGTERKSVDSTSIRRSNEVNLVTALAGKAANVNVQQTSGEAGSGARVQIRGVRSLGVVGAGGNLVSANGQPLFVIDGTPVNNSTAITGSAVSSTSAPNRAGDINPEDIESIEILSGPSASAIYGTLAGNGVVLITTKRAKGGATTYSLRSNTSFDNLNRDLPFQQQYGIGTGGQTPTAVANNTPGAVIGTGFGAWGPQLAAGTPTFDHSRLIFSQGRTFDNTLQTQGGNERTSFLLSGGLLRQDGYFVSNRDYYNRYTARFNGSHRATDALQFLANVSYARTQANLFGRGNNTNGLFLPSLRTPPEFDNRQYLTAEGIHRSFRRPNPTAQQRRTSLSPWDNPFYVLNESENPQQVDRVFGNTGFNWSPLNWLRVNYTLGADFAADDRLEGRPDQSGGLAPAAGPAVTRWQFNDRIIDHNLTATAERQWNTNLRTSLLVGQNINQQSRRQIFTQGNGLVAPRPLRLANTVSLDPSQTTDAETRQRLESYFGQVQVDFLRQIFLTASVRNDGSSTFGVDNNRVWYPQGSLAWSFTEGRSIPGVSFGKVRVAYGESGNLPSVYLTQNIYLGQSSPFLDFNPGSQLVPALNGFGGLYTSLLQRNPRLRPERTGEFSTGADLAFFKNRVDAGVTYYVQQGRDIIIPNFALSPSTGFTTAVLNSVRMRNIGLEVQASARLIETRDWRVELGGNYAFNRNRVQSLGDTSVKFVPVGSSFIGRQTNAEIGNPLGVIRGSDFARCRYGEATNVVSTVDINAVCRAAGAPEGAMYLGANGRPLVDQTFRNLGNPQPNYTAGLRSNVSFRGLSLGAFVDIRNGGTIQNMTKGSLYQQGTHGDTRLRGTAVTFGRDFKIAGVGPANYPVVGPGVDPATNAGRPTTLDEAWFTGAGGIGGAASQFQEDAGFVRLREVSLGLNLNQPWVVRRTGFRSVDLRLSGRNLGLFTNYTGYDPETSLSGGSVITQGFDWFNPPTSRSVVLTVGLNR